MPAFATATFPNLDGAPKDGIAFGWAFDDDATSSTVQNNIQLWMADFIDGSLGGATHPLSHYLANCYNDNGEFKVYDLAGHLDGSPHGSPVATELYTKAASGGPPRGNQVSAVLTAISTAYATTPVSGGTGVIPTPEAAQDMGAPATHPGTLRMKQRQSSRTYWGALWNGAVSTDGNNNSVLEATLLSNAALILPELITGAGSDHSVHWSCWSRRNAALAHVSAGWIDHRVATRRKREFVPNVRTPW